MTTKQSVEPLPWLLVVARNTIANHRRTRQRGARLIDAVAGLERQAAPAGGTEEAVAERQTMLALLAALTPMEREALLLVAWDGLSPADAAAVAGCSDPHSRCACTGPGHASSVASTRPPRVRRPATTG